MKPIEELPFTDDYMFGYVMRNEEICKGLLERLLGIKIQRLEFPTLQKTIAPHYESKGVRLDVYVQDSSRVFDIEIQNSLHDDLPTRTRYYQSMMDIDLLLKGKQYSELKESNLPESSLYLSDAFWSKKIIDETTLPGFLGAGATKRCWERMGF